MGRRSLARAITMIIFKYLQHIDCSSLDRYLSASRPPSPSSNTNLAESATESTSAQQSAALQIVIDLTNFISRIVPSTILQAGHHSVRGQMLYGWVAVA